MSYLSFLMLVLSNKLDKKTQLGTVNGQINQLDYLRT